MNVITYVAISSLAFLLSGCVSGNAGSGSGSSPVTPTVTGVSPTFGAGSGATPATIVGSGFSTTTPNIVKFGDAVVATAVASSSTSMTVVAPAYDPSTVNPVTVSVETTSGTGSLASAFTYDPAISSISPSTNVVTGNPIVLTGTFTSATSLNTTVNVNSSNITPTSVSTNQIMFIAPTGASGQVFTVNVNVSSGARPGTSNTVLYQHV